MSGDAAFEDFRTKLGNCTRKAVCGRTYVLVDEFTKWMRDRAEPNSSITQAGRLLMAAYRDTSHPGFLPVTSEQIFTGDDCSLLVFSILLELGVGNLVNQFQANELVDKKLPIRLWTLENNLDNMRLPNAKELAARFDEVQWRFCPARFELGSNKEYQGKRIIPICQKRLINKGGTAQVWEISVQEQFVGPKIRAMVESSRFNDPNDEFGDVSPRPVPCFTCAF